MTSTNTSCNLSATNPSLMIPRVFPNITERRIATIFTRLNLGVVDRVDLVPREARDGSKFNMAFIHFKTWNDTDDANAFKTQILLDNGDPIQVTYDDPWFWKIYLNKGAKRAPREHRAPTFQLPPPKLDSEQDFPPALDNKDN